MSYFKRENRIAFFFARPTQTQSILMRSARCKTTMLIRAGPQKQVLTCSFISSELSVPHLASPSSPSMPSLSSHSLDILRDVAGAVAPKGFAVACRDASMKDTLLIVTCQDTRFSTCQKGMYVCMYVCMTRDFPPARRVCMCVCLCM